MKNCFLCLRIDTEYNKFIRVQSPQWLQLDIINIVEKHFWPLDNSDYVYGICETCWSQLYDFHKFYTTIEEAHGKSIQIDIKDNCILDMEVQEMTPRILKIESISSEEFILPNNEIVENMKIEESRMPTITVNNDMESINTAQTKKKRGRPRKIRDIMTVLNIKPKGKRGRPRKYAIEKSDLNTNAISSFRNGSRTTYPIIVNFDNHQKITGATNSRYLETPLIKTSNKGRPPKKRRGRPPKVQLNEIINITSTGDEIANSPNESLVNTQCSIVQLITDCPIVNSENLSTGVSSNLNDKQKHKTKEFEYKQNKFKKKRQRIQQHKALMRNYIATSVRCMKFLKK
ncbi:uncharacterized protein LOC135962204 [Calliphora vicina]|uniref:uncharacterized protein LOC135962204 n=1 Tax=Calliphora vicina TaxID=7373 RepID=UPI00325B3068